MPKKAKAAKTTGGSVIHHKAFSYTNKAGKTVNVKAHDERHPTRGGKPRAPKTVAGQTIHHKEYSYTNKAGKSITVRAHDEHRKGEGVKRERAFKGTRTKPAKRGRRKAPAGILIGQV